MKKLLQEGRQSASVKTVRQACQYRHSIQGQVARKPQPDLLPLRMLPGSTRRATLPTASMRNMFKPSRPAEISGGGPGELRWTPKPHAL